MSFFSKSCNKDEMMERISELETENERLRDSCKEYICECSNLELKNEKLRNLCEEKDEFFKEMISDGLRHGSSLAGKHMSDRNDYLKGR